MGIEEEIDSPSFVLMKEYSGGRIPLYHLDLYRLKNREEISELGLFDIPGERDYCYRMAPFGKRHFTVSDI